MNGSKKEMLRVRDASGKVADNGRSQGRAAGKYLAADDLDERKEVNERG